MKKDEILKSHQDRFACKKFDTTKKISSEDLRSLLEIARLSPSSIGLEPWRFLVVQDKALRQKLQPACWNQKQIVEASEIIVILSRTKESIFESGYLRDHLSKRGKDPDMYSSFLSGLNIDEWAKKQCYIALANIMSSAKMMGIDSCAIEGFNSSREVAEILEVDGHSFDVAVIVALGYRDMPITPKSRLDFDEVVHFC